MKSRAYLVSGDERISLQCEIMFGGEYIGETVSSLAINDFVLWLEIDLETPQKEQKLGEKFLKETSFQVRIDL